MEREKAPYSQNCKNRFTFRGIVGRAPKLCEALSLAYEAARTDITVLLLGESGTGKELLARAIHANSGYQNGPFVAINCMAFPETLLESELFGYERGAFTGAEKTKLGRFELASGGTLFLDEIGDMSLQVQVKLLRVLEEKEFMRLGGTTPIKTNVRIITATNKDLTKLVREGRFREDLFYRINVYPITLPPLRERKEDIPLLVDYFISESALRMKKKINGISPEALKMLTEYHWVGNVRELENVIERAVILCRNNLITPAYLPYYVTHGPLLSFSNNSTFCIPPEGLNLEELERDILLQALERSNYNKSKAARLIGLSRSKFRYRLKRYKLTP